jgi:hypothetical protein
VTKWNCIAMGETGLSGNTAKVAQPIASAIAKRTGRSTPQILAIIGAGFLAISLIDFLRTVDAAIEAGRTAPAPSASHSGSPTQGYT